MKLRKKSLVSNLLCLAVFASASFAATSPLNNPRGLAVDAKGNLYVANTLGGANGTGNILVYSPAYVQLPKKTITQNINLPAAVAFDPSGNLWVANDGASNGGTHGSVAEYIAGVQNMKATIAQGIVEPTALAVDGMDNLWVENNFGNIAIYGSNSAYAPPTVLMQTLTPPPPLAGMAIVGNDVLAYSSNGFTLLTPATPALVSASLQGYAVATTGVALAGGTGGTLYIAADNQNIYFALPNQGASYLSAVPFVPAGIAVDNARGRLYVSSGFGNSIYVISATSGAILDIIQ
jgi:sugar lactone lactonase YvrE